MFAVFEGYGEGGDFVQIVALEGAARVAQTFAVHDGEHVGISEGSKFGMQAAVALCIGDGFDIKDKNWVHNLGFYGCFLPLISAYCGKNR